MGDMVFKKDEVLWLAIIAVASASAILGTVFCLINGIAIVFPFLYILPIICAVYFYPQRAVLFTLCISLVFIGLVYTLGKLDPFLVAVSTAWFAIFITLAVVASSYANELNEEKTRIRRMMENTPDGFFSFDPSSRHFIKVNPKLAQWLSCSRDELENQPAGAVWTDTDAQLQLIASAAAGKTGIAIETIFRQKNGGLLRCAVAPLYVTRSAVLCSVVNLTDLTVADEEIRQTLEDLERQVKERTSHLEKMNEELRAEITERRRLEKTLLSKITDDEFGDKKEKKP